MPEVSGLKRLYTMIAHQALPHHERRVELVSRVSIQASEGGRHHANDCEHDAVDPHGAAQDGGIPTELLLPEIVSDHHDGIAPRHSILFRSKCSTEFGLDAHYRKE